ncbi:MAG: hypothetical protein ACI8PZ_000026 [Myxococcota bacterium]
MDKGTRIRIVKGRKGKGVAGTVFWEGPNKWGEGTRLGIEGDDGQTYWIASDSVEPLTKAEDAGPPPPPEVSKGDRVAYQQGDAEGVGRVFWVGKGRNGGLRLGINDDESEEPVWLDARAVRVLDDGEMAAPSPPPSPRALPTQPAASPADDYGFIAADEDDEPPPPVPWSGPVGEPPQRDEPPPFDYAPVDDDDDLF